MLEAKRVGVQLWICLALGLSACGGSAAPTATPQPAGDAVHGQVVFTSTCSACHGPDGTGLPSLGKDLTTSTFIQGKSDADLVTFIKTGRPVDDPLNTTGVAMPPRGGNPALTDLDLLDVVAFIRTINH